MPTKYVAVGVTRFDIPERNTFGYMVRVSRQGVKHHQFFSDSKFGGKRKAQAAALAKHQELCDTLPAPSTSKDRLTARNQTGIVGVYVATSFDSQGRQHDSYCACWTDSDGIRRKVSFPVKKYGKKKAKELACLARQKQIPDRSKVESRWNKTASGKTPRRKK